MVALSKNLVFDVSTCEWGSEDSRPSRSETMMKIKIGGGNFVHAHMARGIEYGSANSSSAGPGKNQNPESGSI